RSGQKPSIDRSERGPLDLPAQDCELVTQHNDLEFFELRRPKQQPKKLGEGTEMRRRKLKHGTSAERQRAVILRGWNSRTPQAGSTFQDGQPANASATAATSSVQFHVSVVRRVELHQNPDGALAI